VPVVRDAVRRAGTVLPARRHPPAYGVAAERPVPRHEDPQPVSPRARARGGRHGRGVPGLGRGPRAQGGGEDPAPRPHHQEGHRRAFSPRGADCPPARSPRHRARGALRAAPRRQPVPRAGVPGGPDAARGPGARPAFSPGPRHQGGDADWRRGGLHPRAGHHPPRPQARKHHPHAPRGRPRVSQGARFRHREEPPRVALLRDADGAHLRHRAVHLPRRRRGRRRRPAQRRVLPRGHRVPAPRGAYPLRGRRARTVACEAHARGAAAVAPLARRPRRAAPRGGRHHARPREESRGAARQRHGVCPRPARGPGGRCGGHGDAGAHPARAARRARRARACGDGGRRGRCVADSARGRGAAEPRAHVGDAPVCQRDGAPRGGRPGGARTHPRPHHGTARGPRGAERRAALAVAARPGGGVRRDGGGAPGRDSPRRPPPR
jgi:hypothetical protein